MAKVSKISISTSHSSLKKETDFSLNLDAVLSVLQIWRWFQVKGTCSDIQI